MKLQVFDGGVSNRLEAQLLQQNQGVVYENIDNSRGILAPNKDKLLTAEEGVKKHFQYFNAEDIFVSSDTKKDYLEYQRTLYATDRLNRPTKLKAGETSFLGIQRPTVEIYLAPNDPAPPLQQVTVLQNLFSGDLPASAFNYLLFNVKGSVYSVPYVIETAASDTATLRASGVLPDSSLTLSELLNRYGAVTTKGSTTNRSVSFSALRGTFGDSAKLYRLYNNSWHLLHTFSSLTDTFEDITEDISANEELDPSKITPYNGIYTYVYTYYNANDGTESAPSPVSEELPVYSGGITCTNLAASTDPQVTNIRLYRVGGNLTQFTLVTTLDNVSTSYTDKLTDTQVDGRLLESDNYYEAPEGLAYLSEAYAMLFGAVGSTLRFTPTGRPNAWPPEYSIEYDSDITGIGAVANGLLVMTEFKTHIVTGTGPFTLATQSLRGDQGCIAFESIKEADKGTLIWASSDGLCTSSGNNVVNLTKAALGEIRLDPVDSVVLDEVYYCHLSDGKTLCWDYRFNVIPKYLELGVQTIGKAKGELYGWVNDSLYIMFKSTELTTFKYTSPKYVEGSITEIKTYKKVYIRSKGDIIISIYIDGEEVVNKQLNTEDTHVLQVPQDLQRGYFIQFHLSGTGVVDEIEYKAGRRQDG